jgi:GNAT superfamily N-acetyltransferase
MQRPFEDPIRVRDGVATDYPTLTAIVAGSFQEFQTFLAQEAFAHYLAELLQIELRGSNGRVVVAEEEGQVLGTASYFPHAPGPGLGWPAGWVSLRALGVVAQARRRGIGRRLVEACAARARKAGGTALCAHTSEAMAGAVLFFDHLGFRRVNDFDLPPARDPVTSARRSGPWSWAFMLPLV